MTTALDTNIVIDLAGGAEAVVGKVEERAEKGELMICEVVYAELCGGMPPGAVDDMLEKFGIALVPSDREVLAMAGGAWRKYLHQGGASRSDDRRFPRRRPRSRQGRLPSDS